MKLTFHLQPFQKHCLTFNRDCGVQNLNILIYSDAVLLVLFSYAGACLLSRSFSSLQTMRFHSLYFLFCLSLLNYFNHGLSACSLDSSEPIYLPIKNVTLPEHIQKRGIALSVGTPEQTLVFQVTGLDLCFFLARKEAQTNFEKDFGRYVSIP